MFRRTRLSNPRWSVGWVLLLIPVVSLLWQTGVATGILLNGVELGGCFDTVDNALIHCAAIPEECAPENRVRFQSARMLRALLRDTTSTERCFAEHVPVGHCGTEDGPCAITADHCARNEAFFPPSREHYTGEAISSCTALHDTRHGTASDGVELPTYYGGCLDGTTGAISCMLEPSQCLPTEAWISARRALELGRGCQCHDIPTGICTSSSMHSSTNDVVCAVTKDDCGFTTFVPARTVLQSREYSSRIDCRLCSTSIATTGTFPSTSPAPNPSPTPLPTRAPVAPVVVASPSSSSSSSGGMRPVSIPVTSATNNNSDAPSSDSKQLPWIVAGVVAVTAVLLVAVLLGVAMFGRRNMKLGENGTIVPVHQVVHSRDTRDSPIGTTGIGTGSVASSII